MIITEGILDDFQFDDIDDFNHRIRDWDLQFSQLSKGRLKGIDINFIKPNLQFSYCHLNKKVIQAGTTPYGVWTFGFFISESISWKGMKVEQDEILALKPGSEINGVSLTDYKVHTVSIPESILEKVCEEQELTEVMKIIRNHEIVKVDKMALDHFKYNLMNALKQIQLNSNHKDANGFLELYDHEIPLQLCQLIEGPGLKRKFFKSSKKNIILKKTNELLTETEPHPFTVSELCQITGVSERTLQYTFNEYYGLSPKAFLKTHLLNHVHSALREANPDTANVVDIAYQWGFWHMGQFGVDYKEMFGKLPSETLNKLV